MPGAEAPPGAMRPAPHVRIRRGLGGHAFAQAVGIAIQVAGVPLYLHFWGLALYGEWLIAIALQGWFLTVDFGYSATMVNDAAMRAARGDFAGARAGFQSAWALVTSLSLGAAAVVALFGFAPLAAWLGLAELSENGIVLPLLIAQALAHLQSGLFGAGLTAAGQYGLLALVLTLTRAIGFAFAALAAALGGGPGGAALALALAELAGLVCTAALARRHSPWLRPGLADASVADMRRLAPASLGLSGLALGNALVIQGPVLVIGAALGPAAAAVFTTLRLLARMPVQLAGILFATLRAEATFAHGRGERGRLRQLNTQAVQFAFWWGAATMLALLAVGPFVVAFWTGGEIAVRQPLFALLLASAFATLLWIAAGTALMAANRSQRIAVAYTPAAALALLAAAALTPSLGADGAAAALAIGEWLVFALVARRALTFLDQRPSSLAIAALRPPTDLVRLLRPDR